MPKAKRKGKSDRISSGYTSDEDDCNNDNGSVLSVGSECRSNEDEEVDEVAAQEVFEGKILEALDGITQKSAQGRTLCYESVCKAFMKKLIPDFVFDRRLTICDGIEKGLKRGRGAEQAVSAQLASLLCIQLGSSEANMEVSKSLNHILLATLNDKSMQPSVRAKCCTALGMTTFLAGGEMGDVLDILRQFESIFSASYLKGDGSAANVSAELQTLHAAALNAWGFLFTLMSPGDVYSMMGDAMRSFAPSIEQLSTLLLSSHLEMRMAAGEALALVFELGREFREDFAELSISDLVDKLHELATDSNKHRAKKDRKQQRATFRDIVNFIENDQFTDERIKFGGEVLVLDSWCKRKQYEMLCTVLGSGINIHLAENELLRDIFALGGRQLIDEMVTAKQSKMERAMINAAAFKARTITRGKNRDKRSDF